VIGKAEVMRAGDNPRFVVTSLPAEGFATDAEPTRFTPARLYEECYCARGDLENQLKQQVLDLRADRLSTHHLGSNQLRLWLSTLAYLLLERLRAVGLAGTELAQATAGSLRVKLLKVAAQVRISVRRVYVQLSSAWPWRETFGLCARRLRGRGAPQGELPLDPSAASRDNCREPVLRNPACHEAIAPIPDLAGDCAAGRRRLRRHRLQAG